MFYLRLEQEQQTIQPSKHFKVENHNYKGSLGQTMDQVFIQYKQSLKLQGKI